MLPQALRAMGFDLEREVTKVIARGREQLAAAGARTVDQMKAAMGEVAQSAIMLTAGIVFSAAAVGLASAALYLFVEERYGTYAALGVVGGIAAVLAASLIYAALPRSEADEDRTVAPEAVAPIAEPTVEPAPPPVRPSAYLSTLIPPPPPGAPLTEILLHQAKTRGAEAADEAIGQAEKVIRSGSRPAMVTTLALTALVGLYFGRQKRF